MKPKELRLVWATWLGVALALVLAHCWAPLYGQTTCDQPPVFGQWDDLPDCPVDATPVTPCVGACSPERQRVQCGCSECLFWDPEPLATWYELNRETISSGVTVWVGSVERRLSDEDGTLYLPTTWCPPWDLPFPREGTVYRYRVRACNLDAAGQAQCGPWDQAGVLYAAAPYWCGAQAEGQCYVGDPLASR